MEVLKTIGMIIGSLIALIMAFIGLGGIISSFRKLNEKKTGAITELLIATTMLILSITFLLFSGFYFDILSMEFFKIFFMIFTPLVLAIATYGCFKSKRILAGIVCILVLFALLGGAYLFAYNHTRGSERAALAAAQQAVIEQLKDPSSAEFSPTTETTITADGDTWTVVGWVEAKNSFNATIRNEYTVVVTFFDKGQYTINSVVIK